MAALRLAMPRAVDQNVTETEIVVQIESEKHAGCHAQAGGAGMSVVIREVMAALRFAMPPTVICAASSTHSIAPGTWGADPRLATTIHNATPRPASASVIIVSRISIRSLTMVQVSVRSRLRGMAKRSAAMHYCMT